MSNGLTSKYETYHTAKYYFSRAIQFLLACGEVARMWKLRGSSIWLMSALWPKSDLLSYRDLWIFTLSLVNLRYV